MPAQQRGALIPRRVLFARGERFQVKLSPDGRQVSYLDSVGRVWAAPLSDPMQAKVLIPAPKGNVQSYSWAFDRRHVLYTSPIGKGTHVFAHDLSGGPARDLTPGEGVQARIERLSPDRPQEVLVGIAGQNPSRTDLYRIRIDTGEQTLVLKDEGYAKVLTDAQFKPRAAVRAKDSHVELLTYQEDGTWKTLSTLPDLGITALDWENETGDVADPLLVDREGRKLYLADNRGHDTVVLKEVDLQTGKEKVLIEDRQADLTPVLFTHPETGRVQGGSSYYPRLRRHLLDRSLKKDFEYLKSVHSGDIGVSGRSLDDRVWLVIYLDGGPFRWYAYDRKSKRVSFLFSDHPDLEKYDLASRHAVTVPGRDGLRLPGDLYLPIGTDADGNGRPQKPLPLLVTVHGGPYVAYPWNSWETNRMLQLLANRGYAVLRVEYRGAVGFGKKLLNAGKLEWGGRMNDSFVDAAAWAVKERIAERGRVGIWGWSYGGYETVAALTFHPQAFACGVALYPPTDLEALLREIGPTSRPQLNRCGDVTSPAGRAALRARSPVYHAGQIRAPLLLSAGLQDAIVAPAHSDRLVKAMLAEKKPVIYLSYPDEGHDYNRPENWASFWGVTERFLHEHLGGRYEPVGDDLTGSSLKIAAGAGLIPGLSPGQMSGVVAPAVFGAAPQEARTR
jgi:dipeptidyl aminopeptidase/acylaminoacyl peptidase